MKQSIIFMLAATMLLMTACGEKAPQKTENAGVDSTEQTELPETDGTYHSSIDIQDFGGEDIRFLTFTAAENINSVQNIVAEGLTGAVLNDAVYDRNNLLREKFNINIVTDDAGDWQGFVNTVNKTVMANDTEAFDILMGPTYGTMQCGLAGAILNMNDLPYIDLEKPWWNSRIVEATSILNTNYFLMGDMNLNAWTQSYVLYFNEEMAEEYDLENLYQLVRDGKWTLDKLYSLVRGVYSDANGNGKYDEKDVFGLASGTILIDSFFAASGVRFIEKNDNDEIELVFSDQFYDMYDSISSLLAEQDTLITDKWTNKAEFYMFDKYAFLENRALFFIESLSTGDQKLRDMEYRFGILPIPKYNESDDVYGTYSHSALNCSISLPITVGDELDKLCMILEDMAYFSMETVRPAYYEKMLTGRLAQNQDSAEMLDIITHNITYDLAYQLFFLDMLFDGTGLRGAVFKGGESGSFVAAHKDVYSAKCEQIMETILENNSK